MAAIDGVEAPLAEWRVFGEVAPLGGDRAGSYGASAVATIERIAGSLAEDQPLAVRCWQRRKSRRSSIRQP
jgi:hypothetical protein